MNLYNLSKLELILTLCEILIVIPILAYTFYLTWKDKRYLFFGLLCVILIIVDILEVADDHNYENSKIDRKEFYGYNCCIDFCNWLFSAENKGSTVLAHNGGGYDYKFVLQYCLQRALKPDCFIRQGSHITFMKFEK